MATEKSLRSILLGWWSWPEAAGAGVLFKEDGTGGVSQAHMSSFTTGCCPLWLTRVKLLCGEWPKHWIAAELEWKPLGDSASTLDQVVDFNKDFEVTFDIEMTLRKQVMPEAKEYAFEGFNEVHLTDVAFRARTYKVQLTKKMFAAADLSMYGLRSATPPGGASGYGMRIVFDKSPYPPAEEWRQDAGRMWDGAQERRFWEYRDFYRETEESRELIRPDEAVMAERRRKVLERAAREHREREAEAARLAQSSESVNET